MSLPLPETPAPFESYDLTVAGKTYTVLEPSEPTAHRIREPDHGQVIGLPCADSSVELTEAALAALLAAPVAMPVPASVTRRQLFLWLNASPRNITRAMLRASLVGNEAALIELDEAAEFQRTHPLVASLASSLGIDADTAFREAAVL